MPKMNRIMPKDNDAFCVFLNSVPKGNYNNVRQIIIERCKISPNVLKFWQNGTTRIPYLAKKEIEKIAKQKIFEI